MAPVVRRWVAPAVALAALLVDVLILLLPAGISNEVTPMAEPTGL